jgi:uncharacterized protein (DUF2235 family)
MALYAFDGTWNRERNQGEYGRNTNVVGFRAAYTCEPDKKPFYTKGVGTKLGWFGRIIDGAFGAGGCERLDRAYEDLRRRYSEGDTHIDIIGFSRGAALEFANRIGDRGIKTLAGETVQPRIRFLGLWDVVAAFGILIDLGRLMKVAGMAQLRSQICR